MPHVAGAAFVASKLDAIAANPDLWAKTVFIISYDENDGIFDHVVPCRPRHGGGRWLVICAWTSHRRGFSRSVPHHFTVDGRRLGLQ